MEFVAINTCPVVGAADAYVLTNPAPDVSHKPLAITLFVLLVRVLLIKVSVVLRPTNVSEMLGNVSVSFIVWVVASVVAVPVVASKLLNSKCLVLSATP